MSLPWARDRAYREREQRRLKKVEKMRHRKRTVKTLESFLNPKRRR